MKDLIITPISITNSPISTGSFVFTGSVLLFHKTDGQPFTVTYTTDEQQSH
jgi:hypothetical protein